MKSENIGKRTNTDQTTANQSRAKKAFRAFGALAALALCLSNYSAPMRALRALPDTVRVAGAELPESLKQGQLAGLLTWDQTSVPVTASTDERLQEKTEDVLTCRLFGVLPVKTVELKHSKDVYLIPGGTAVGITIRTQGVLVVGLGAVDTDEGMLSPGNAAGIKAGDVILAADGEPIKNADHLAKLTRASDGELELMLLRDGESIATSIQLVRDTANDTYRIGLWVRDSTAGVGTLSFYDPEEGWFAALGHPVSDIDTQSLLSVRDGRIVSTQIVSVRKGEQGAPGELMGEFAVSGEAMGEILVNSEFGIFGKTHKAYENPIYGPLSMAYGFEAHTGPAQILATVSTEGVQAFDCQVVRVNAQSKAATKGMVIDITDERLLSATGGIVQGMSGCPILQDGKLIGVVTHVFVNDPTRGYCIYAEWMLEQIQKAG